MDKHDSIHSGIPTPDKKIPIIPLRNYSYSRENNPTDSSSNYLITVTIRMHLKITARVTIKREGILYFI